MKTQTQISGRHEAIQGTEFHSQVLPNELSWSIPQSVSPASEAVSLTFFLFPVLEPRP